MNQDQDVVDLSQQAIQEQQAMLAELAEWARRYRAVFSGDADPATAALVLKDLATFTGFYRANPMEFTAEQCKYTDGMKNVFARIANYMQMSESELQALEGASRRQFLDL